jgi:Rrf2 family transcriptional regulator, cysteine metabolism repressor
MLISKKSRYALKAVFELAKRKGDGPIKIADIAKPQAIPQRFLEAILVQLKQSGLVESRRGSEGGYQLARDPENITVGDVLRVVQGLPEPVECVGKPDVKCPMSMSCVFIPMWEKMMNAITDVYDSTNYKDLLIQDNKNCKAATMDYAI